MFSSKSGILLFLFVFSWFHLSVTVFLLVFEQAAKCQFPMIIHIIKLHVQAVGSSADL